MTKIPKKYVVTEMDIHDHDSGGVISHIYGPFDTIEDAHSFEKSKNYLMHYGIEFMVHELEDR